MPIVTADEEYRTFSSIRPIADLPDAQSLSCTRTGISLASGEGVKEGSRRQVAASAPEPRPAMSQNASNATRTNGTDTSVLRLFQWVRGTKLSCPVRARYASPWAGFVVGGAGCATGSVDQQMDEAQRSSWLRRQPVPAATSAWLVEELGATAMIESSPVMG